MVKRQQFFQVTHTSFVYPSELFPTMWAKLWFVKKPFEKFNVTYITKKQQASWFQPSFNQTPNFLPVFFWMGNKKRHHHNHNHQHFTGSTVGVRQVWAFGSNRSMELGGPFFSTRSVFHDQTQRGPRGSFFKWSDMEPL